MLPTSSDWDFGKIAETEVLRAARLERAPSSDEQIENFRADLCTALKNGDVRFGVDEYQGHWRANFQFRVLTENYDDFFNSRHGYRAHFWISPEVGLVANRHYLDVAKQMLTPALRSTFPAGEIQVEFGLSGRVDRIVAFRELTSAFFAASLQHPAAKLWICERLLPSELGIAQEQPIHDSPRLLVKRWPLAFAPKGSWLDLKGGSLGGVQTKHYQARANEIHKTGST